MNSRRLALFICLLLSYSLAAQDSHTINLWCDLEPMVHDNGEFPVPRKDALAQMLREAHFFFSGMIYGFSFQYTPADHARGVKEKFNLNPIGQIPLGDKRLTVLSTWKEGTRLYAQIRYDLGEFQQQRLLAWQSNTIPLTQAYGHASYFLGQEEKIEAYKDAVKQGIRDYLRKRVFNKPKEILGEVLFWGSPRTFIDAGEYVSRVRFKLLVKELVPYRRF